MTLRNRANSLAWVKVAPEYNPALYGRVVDVLNLAPAHVIVRLPDGNFHEPVQDGCWVIQLRDKILARGDLICLDTLKPAGLSIRLASKYLVAPDYALEPITPAADALADLRREISFGCTIF